MKIFFILIAIVSISTFSQTPDTLSLTENQSVVIDSIRIEGNDITQEFIILRELTFETGNKVDKETIRFNRERVYSLGLFNYVDFYLLKSSEGLTLVIDIFEKWYFYPVPFLYFNEGDLKRATYGLNFLWQNFRGRNEVINVFLAFGYDPTIRLRYFNPAILFNEDISFAAAVQYQDFSNKSYNAELLNGGNFEYTIYSAEVMVGKRLNKFNEVFAGLGYSYVETPGIAIEGVTATGRVIDRIPFVDFEYVYDSRDLKQFPKNGLFTKFRYTHKGLGFENISYNIINLDFREYREVFNLFTARWRVAYRKAFGDIVPFYDYSYLGYNEFIRGHRDTEIEGLQHLLGSFELSYTVIDEWNLSLDLPVIPKSLTSARIGLHLNLFTDAGTTFDRFDELRLNNFYSGYGAGLNILFLPHNIVRFEYAFNELGDGEFIIGTGFFF